MKPFRIAVDVARALSLQNVGIENSFETYFSVQCMVSMHSRNCLKNSSLEIQNIEIPCTMNKIDPAKNPARTSRFSLTTELRKGVDLSTRPRFHFCLYRIMQLLQISCNTLPHNALKIHSKNFYLKIFRVCSKSFSNPKLSKEKYFGPKTSNFRVQNFWNQPLIFRS